MASAPNTKLPILYKDLVPLNSNDHGKWHVRTVDRAPWVVNQHAVPLTVEEFPLAQRDYPIVFSQGERPVPLALMGLNEGVNTFFNEEGTLRAGRCLRAGLRAPLPLPAGAARSQFGQHVAVFRSDRRRYR